MDENLIVVPSTAYKFRTWTSALYSLNEQDGVSFHTFMRSEDRCLRLLVKNLCRVMPESVVREELKSLKIRVRGFTHLRSGYCDQGPTKDRLPTPYFIISVARGMRCGK